MQIWKYADFWLFLQKFIQQMTNKDMKNKDLKLGLITTALYLTVVAALLSIMACIGSFMQIG